MLPSFAAKLFQKKMFNNLEILWGVVVMLITLYYYLKTCCGFWKRRGVPGPEPVLGFGNILKGMFGKESLPEFLTRVYNGHKSEPLIGAFLRTIPVLFVKDPGFIKDVLIKDFSKFVDRGFLKSEPVRKQSHLQVLTNRVRIVSLLIFI